MSLDPKLLLTEENLNSELKSSFSANKTQGSYSPMQFVIRLHKDVHNALDKDDLSFEKVQAFSTYMHENIHWWQHVGSHLGFLTSLSYPALAHTAHRDLSTMVSRDEKFKPILQYDKWYYSQTGKHNNPEINSILNYYYDIFYAKAFILDNNNIEKIIKDKRFFLNMGHCFHVLWSSSIHLLATSIDKDYNFLPNIHKWSENFKKLEENKIKGFYIDSNITIAPLGTKAIYEGQARFNQLQYLTIAADNKYSYEDFEHLGMLHEIYIEAFNLFLELTKIERPNNFNTPVIGLFLLVCDIAINPVDGFPFDIYHYETFIISNDPGTRFTMLCQVIGKDTPKWNNAVQNYSREEYIEFTELLCSEIVCIPPLYGSAIVADWAQKNDSVKELLEEESKMKFKPENMEIRLFASKYIRFQQDKIKYPSIFCWTGKSMTKEADKELTFEIVEHVFNRHRALFIDDVEGTIKPSTFDNCNQEDIYNTFQLFFTCNTTHDMIMKWITENGSFKYDYQWLTKKHDDQIMINWIRNNFKEVFNIYPEELNVL